MVPVYAPAGWAAPGVTVAPTNTDTAPAALNPVVVAVPDGVKLVHPAGLVVGLVQPVQVPIGRLLAPLTRLAGRVNATWTGVLA